MTYNLEPETSDDIAIREKLTKQYLATEVNLTKEQEGFLSSKLGSKLWRLNNLYTIRNKDGIKMKLKLNKSQYKVLTENTHPKKIILKSRQQGISTLFLAYYLDSCLFTPGFQAGIQSYGQDEADKLAKRALLMWEELDQNVKDILNIKLVSNNQKGMTFSNGAVLKIGNFRGDTLQGLHVSELGKIAKKFPDKARELKTGAFQAVGKNNKITIESTAEGASGLFYEMCMSAKALRDVNAELTPLDFTLIFIGWTDDPDCTLDKEPFVPPHKRYLVSQLDEYFKKVEEGLGITLSQEQKNWYLAKKIELGEDIKQEYPSSIDEAFEHSVEGTILKEQYELLLKEKRVIPDLFNPNYPVTVSFDIGVNDEAVMHFAQIQGNKPCLVNTYANSRLGIEHYVAIMQKLADTKGYNIVDVILPHDGNVLSFSTGKTRLQTFKELGVPARIIPKTSEKDGVEAIRQLVNVLWVDQSLEKTLKAMQLYRWKVDKQLNVTLPIPLHDWTSNYMKSLQYLAQGWDYTDYSKYNLNYNYYGI